MKTLTEMLREINPDDVELYKEAFKEWLKAVNLPSHGQLTQDATRQLLITLVDEP